MAMETVTAAAVLLEGNKLFALPLRVAEPFMEEFCKRGIAYEKRIVKVDPYSLDACLFRGANKEDARRILAEVLAVVGEAPFASAVTARWGNRKVAYFNGKLGFVAIIPDIPKSKDNAKGKLQESVAYSELERVFTRFSRLTGGLHVALHEENREATIVPRPDRDGFINIYPWNHPPGESEDKYVKRAFNELIDKDYHEILTFGGVPGRGEFISDGENNMVQMIGNNWYLLFCVVAYFNEHTTVRILEKALAATLVRHQALRRGARPADAAIRLNRKLFIETGTKWVSRGPDILREIIEKDEAKIEQKRLDLAELERAVADFRRQLEDIQDSKRAAAIIASLPGEWRRIRSNPRVEGLTLVGDGIHIATIPVVIEHAGCRRNTGRFEIRMNGRGAIHIWNKDRLHPQGVPHPHINLEGTPCMGNATSAINEAVVGHRYADAIDYLLRWLFDGYEDKLALNKISEWPYERVDGDGSVTEVIVPDLGVFAEPEAVVSCGEEKESNNA